jgi:hypothetical protein
MAAPQQPYPQQPYPQPREGFVVTTRYFPLSWVFAFIKPVITLNGWPVPNAVWGRNVVPAPPGQYLLHVHVPYFLPKQIGPADVPVTLYPGQWIEAEYKAPLWTYSKGSLGPPPQSYNGVGVTIAVMVSIFVIAFIVAAMMVVAVS